MRLRRRTRRAAAPVFKGVSDMKNLLLTLILFPIVSMADPVVGTATLKFIDVPDYQPEGCDVIIENDGQEECFEFTYWRRYELVNLVDVRGKRLENQNAVLASHTEIGGEWFLVLEELSQEESLKVGAKYKVIDGSSIFSGTCLQMPLESYDPTLKNSVLVSGDGESCYDINYLQNNNQNR
jgi:hypothetical protein